MRAGEDAHPDHVHVLLDGSGDDLLRGSVEPRVDDIHPSVAERPGDHLGTTVVAVQADLGDEDADGCRDGHLLLALAGPGWR